MRDEVEKTEPPTPHKIEEAKQRGFVPRSREITGLFVLIAIVVFLWFAGERVISSFGEGMGVMGASEVSGGVISFLLNIVVKIIFPVLIIAFIFAVVGNVVQTGFTLSTKAFEPKVEKFNPAENAKRIFSTRGLVEFTKSVAKASFILGILFTIVIFSYTKIDEFFGLDTSHMLPKSASFVLKVIAIILFFLVVLSVVDYAWQRWDWWRSLMMSRSELREEMRRYEGDPQVRGYIKRRMFEMARVRMMAEVPRADVVITNPTHIAVAIKYERGKMKAPQVVAKGMNYIAQKIVEIAKENDIPIYQDPPLAWALYKTTKIGDFIPENLYKAVAKVLAYVIMLKQKGKSGNV